MFYDWTETEGNALLFRKPIEFRRPVRNALDLLWEQVEAGTACNQNKGVFDDLREFINTSFDENDGQDVNMGTGTPLLDAFYDSIGCFFDEKYEDRVSGCATKYFAALFCFLVDQFYEEAMTDDLLSEAAFISEHSLWKNELRAFGLTSPLCVIFLPI